MVLSCTGAVPARPVCGRHLLYPADTATRAATNATNAEACLTLKLKEPRSKIDGSTPVMRETEHFFLDLGELESQIETFLKSRESYWRPNVLRQSLGQIQTEGLHGPPSLVILIGVYPFQ